MADAADVPSTNSVPHLVLQNGVTDSFKKLLAENLCSDGIDCLALAIHELMLEQGFRIQNEEGLMNSSKRLPENWRNNNAYRFDYVYNELKCVVTAMLAGNSLLVTGTLDLDGDDGSDEAYNVKLKTVDYIDLNESKFENKEMIFKNLNELSFKLKEKFSSKLIAEIKTKHGERGLKSIPQELKLRIVFFLDVSSVCKLARVSKEFKTLCGDDEIWKQLLLRDFKASNVQGVSHKEAFQHMYSARKREREESARRRMAEEERLRHPLRPELNIGSSMFPPGPHVPGMRGGYHDLYPGGLPRNPLGDTPDLLLNQNHPHRLPGARYDPIGPHFDDDLDPLRHRRNVHPDLMQRPGFDFEGRLGRGGGRGSRFGGGGFGGGGFGGGLGGFGDFM